MDTKYKCINYQQQLESKAPCNYTSSQERTLPVPPNLPRYISCSHHPLTPSSEIIPIMTYSNYFLTLFIILPLCICISFLWLLEQITTTLGAWNNTKVLSQGTVNYKLKTNFSWSKIKVSTGLCLFLGANPFPGFFSTSRGSQIPWL